MKKTLALASLSLAFLSLSAHADQKSVWRCTGVTSAGQALTIEEQAPYVGDDQAQRARYEQNLVTVQVGGQIVSDTLFFLDDGVRWEYRAASHVGAFRSKRGSLRLSIGSIRTDGIGATGVGSGSFTHLGRLSAANFAFQNLACEQ